VRQNAGPSLAFDGFKYMLEETKYQELMPVPFDRFFREGINY
jgi:hypothetical protein